MTPIIIIVLQATVTPLPLTISWVDTHFSRASFLSVQNFGN